MLLNERLQIRDPISNFEPECAEHDDAPARSRAMQSKSTTSGEVLMTATTSGWFAILRG
jgi:hypothetical protein